MNRAWIITETTGGNPGVYCGAFERYNDALHSISISYSKLHVRVEKEERIGITEVKVDVFKGEGTEIVSHHRFQIKEESILDFADHL